MLSNDTRNTLTEIIYKETDLLDEGNYNTWIDMLSDDYTYWIPISKDQKDPVYSTSLLYEDLFVTKLRINRINNQRSYSQQPKSISQHIVQRPTITQGSHGDIAYGQSNILYIEARGEVESHYASKVFYTFFQQESGWKIKQKKVMLLNSIRPLNSIQLII